MRSSCPIRAESAKRCAPPGSTALCWRCSARVAGPPRRAGCPALSRRSTPSVLRNDAVENLARRLVFSVPRPPDEQLLLELRRRFKPEVLALSEYLGRDLVREWGYERID